MKNINIKIHLYMSLFFQLFLIILEKKAEYKFVAGETVAF